jgi:predicted SAM-dependent methyltransferase
MLLWETRRYLRIVGRLFGWRVLRLLRRRRLPQDADGKVRLHLGCGAIDARGYVNVDLAPYAHVHHVHAVAPLEMLADDQADLVYGSHILEHLSFAAAADALAEWRRVLKPGGILRLSVPDFSIFIGIYRETGRLETVAAGIMGGQDYEGNFHQSVYDEARLTALLREAGFREVRRWDPASVEDHDFKDASSHEWDVDGRKVPISLNLEAVK